MFLKSLISKHPLRATGGGGVLHKRGHTHIVHQQGYGIFLLGGGMHGVEIRGQHIGPIVMRLAKVSTLHLIIIIHLILGLTCTLCGPLIIIHHLSHGCGHASAIRIARFGVKRMPLPPLAFEQGLHGFCKQRLAATAWCIGHRDSALLQRLVGLTIPVQ